MSYPAPSGTPRGGRSRSLRAAGMGASALGLAALAGLGVWLAQPDADTVAAIQNAEHLQHPAASQQAAAGAAASLPGGTDPATRPCLTYAVATADPKAGSRLTTLGASLPRTAGYQAGAASGAAPWLAGVLETSHTVDAQGRWADTMILGGSSRGEQWGDVKTNAGVQLRCLLSSQAYRDSLKGTAPVFSRAETIDGHPAWHIRVRVRTTSGLGDDMADAVVVDGTNKDFYAVLLSGSLVRNAADQRDLDQRIAGLRVA